MKTLHLNLTRKWFDMILSGEKRHEYREITDYWKERLMVAGPFPYCRQDFDTVTFSNGYSKNRAQFVVKLERLGTGTGIAEWGAYKGKRYFILYLGSILTRF